MTLTAWLGVGLAWFTVAALFFQTARFSGPLAAVSLSDETIAAGRMARRRALQFAPVYTLVMIAADLLLPAVHEAVAREVVRMIMFAGCPMIAFWAGAPLMHRGRNQAALVPGGKSSVRVASLVVRDEAEFVPRAWWCVPAAALAAPFVAALLHASGGRPLGSQTWTVVTITVALSVAFAVFWGIWATTTVTARQDLSGVRDPEALDRAYLGFRRFLARGIFWAMALTVVVLCGVGVAAVLLDGAVSQGAMLGAAGGIAGSVVGIAGGVLGTLADRHRRVILELGGTPPDGWNSRRPKSSATREPPAA